MAESDSVVQLEQDLKKVLGIISNASATNDTSLPNASESNSLSEKQVIKKEQPHNMNRKKQNQKKQRNPQKKANDVPPARTDTLNLENVEQVQDKPNTLSSKGYSNKKGNKGAFSKADREVLPGQQSLSHSYPENKPKPGNTYSHSSQASDRHDRGTKTFNRSATSNSNPTPENWREAAAAREAMGRSKASTTNEVKQSVSERAANSENHGQAGNNQPDTGKARNSRKPRKNANRNARKDQVEPENASIGASAESATSKTGKNGHETTVSSATTGHVNGVKKEEAAVIANTSQHLSSPQHSPREMTETVFFSEDGEELVRIVIPPAPPSKPKAKHDSKLEKGKGGEKHKAAEANVEDDSSGDSSSSEESEEVHQQINTQPLIFSVCKSILESFRQRGVFPLKHISPKFPRAIFHCRLCSFHISSLSEVHRHMKDDRHVRNLNQDRSRQTASLMPSPPPEIIESVGQFIESIYQCSGLSKKSLEIRWAAMGILRTMIESAFPGYSVRPYGSVVTELGLEASNFNVGLVELSPQVKKDGLVILTVLRWLQTTASGIFRYISDDLNCRTPVVHFKHEQFRVHFAMVVESDNAHKTTVLLQQYQLIDPRLSVLVVAFRTFARICSLDQLELGSLPAHAFTLMVLFYMQQDGVLPVLHELKNSENEEEYLTAAEFFQLRDNGHWKPRQMTLGQLWLGLLKFYAYTFTHNENAVCVRSRKPLLRSTKNWGNRRIAIEDPFHTNVNIGAFLSTSQAFDFFMECMRNLYHYFWIPQTAEGPLFVYLRLPGTEVTADPMSCTPEEALRKMSSLKKDDIKWAFEPEKILRSKRLPVICGVCGADGHTKQNCKELDIPDIGFIPPPDFNYFSLLDTVSWNVFHNFAQRKIDSANRESIRKELEFHIRSKYPDAILTLFGSSCNGFGFADSDLDLCLTFENNEDGKDLDSVAIVKKLAKILRGSRSFTDILCISSAKVPIVKLRHRQTNLEADISLYNQLGRRNSKLLASYCAIDQRVRILGYMAKLLAKQCGIGDASRGSLSSYAYTLMVIHYLQQVKPPVIPVLQEITVDGVDRGRYIVEGWDTWFFENTQDLARVWPHYGANRESPSTLWLGFLLYYAKLFDYRLQVVSIRQLKPLYRLEKMWTDRPIAIEDPFDLTHNLGSGISLRMGAFIRRVFVNARMFFQTPVSTLPPACASLEEYLFNPKVLIAGGPPPNDRGCLICGKIGHKAKECDRRGKRNRGRENGAQRPPENQQNPTQEAMHNRILPQQLNRVRPEQQQQQQLRSRNVPPANYQMNRVVHQPRYGAPVYPPMNRDKPHQTAYRQPQLANRYRPPRPNNDSSGQSSREKIPPPSAAE